MTRANDFQDRLLLRAHGSGRRTLLVCFHHAGAGASTFTAWPKRLSTLADMAFVQLKGREDRLAESLDESLPNLSVRIANGLSISMHEKIVLFGHSMGAIVAWWVASRLWQDHGRRSCVVVSGQLPQPPALGRDWHTETIDSWFDLVGETMPESMQCPELRDIVMSTLLADLRWMQREFSGPLPGPLPLDIHGLHAIDDRLINGDLMGYWQQYTTRHFTLTRLPGGHLDIVFCPDPYLNFVRNLLLRDHSHVSRLIA